MESASAPLYTERVDRALDLAARAFRHQRRKGSQIPYLAHLLQVMVFVAEHGGDEDQMIAALLHDYLEDVHGARIADLESGFGPRVARLVCALSDAIEAETKPPWETRKRVYLEKLAREPAELKLISTADKLHNALSIHRDYALLREELWARFTASRTQTLWYYRCAVEALGTGWSHPLLDELRRVVRELHDIAHEPYTDASWR